MEFSVFTLEQAAQWDRIVRSFAHFDVYYLSGYVKAFHLHGDGDPLLFFCDSDRLRGINVVMKRDIALDPRFAGKIPEGECFDFVTPYGYGGWLLEGDGDAAPLFAAYEDWCVRNHIVSEFVRFDLFSTSRSVYPGHVVQRTSNVVRTLDHPMSEMLTDFEHKVRKNIKTAENAGLQIALDPSGARLPKFLDIYYATMDRNHADGGYYFSDAFFRQINTLDGNFMYFHVLLDGKVISTELVLLGSENMYSYLGGTAKEYFVYRANDFLKYHIIQWGLDHGFKRFVLGGGYGSDDGIFRYKKSFAPHGIIPFFTGQTVFDPERYDELVALRGELPESGFFPRYRA